MPIDSAGTHVMEDELPPCDVAIAVAAGHGVDISALSSRLLQLEDMRCFEHILTMEHRHIRHLQYLCPATEHHRLKLVTDFARNEFNGQEVPDPFRRGKRHYEQAWQMIAAGIEGLVTELEMGVR